MPIRKFALLLASMAAVYAPGVLADCSGLLCQSVYIQSLNAESGELATNDDIWVQTTGAETALSCTPNSGAWLKLDGDSTRKKEVYALLLMAFSMDKPISIRIVDNSTDCLIAYAYMTR
ncbi:hypothetical protein GCM10011487_65530 [Steroidobacter agaridevorans]|uniref:Uncharacterized protein n=1 Tax=Steroidobacter agaridevorans TaxID=2695856 RepID=A0A829YP19_9GAMM|nr:hypothetical protein [Steroidobacter agaridevorans]GFE84553.1 hypothetical protein GCM10011487_65530 [Steroidobacter agaridevorans]GFE90952.1 hypothetical protein GCM10011488_59060 [Steroidobacter agaridevorans]